MTRQRGLPSRPRRTRRPVGTAAWMAIALLLWPVIAQAKATLSADAIIIGGTKNTAASVAKDIGDPRMFRYDPAIGRAVATRSLVIEGELQLGSEQEWDGLLKYALVVELDVTECGSARIEVVRRTGKVGRLRLYRAKITATHRTKDLDQCTEANLLDVAGELAMQHSTVTGNINVRFEPGAQMELDDSMMSFTRVSGLEMRGASAPDIRIRDSFSVDNGMYGLSVSRLLSSPLELTRTVLRGLTADVFNGGGADIVLTDCDYKTVAFGGRSGSVRREWTVKCFLPKPGAVIDATGRSGAGGLETKSAVAGNDGTCELVLTEYIGTPEHPLPEPGQNTVTPHDLTVYDRLGGKALYRLRGLYVFMRGQEVRLP
jgi:hypothetical protein